jgi:long-chain acyl-CoA synthetase
MDYRSIRAMFESVVSSNADMVAYRNKKDGTWRDVTWTDCAAAVAEVGKGLMALGVEHGQGVAILSQTRFEWVLCDFGAVNVGAVTVGIYPSNLAEDCRYILEHSKSVLVFVENTEQLEKVLKVRAGLPDLRQIVIFEGASDPANDVLAWDEFLQGGRGIEDQAYDQRGKALEPGDLASIVYTSGTTGLPKGVMITHDNLIFTCDSARQCLVFEPGQCTLFFLPLAHVFARLIAYVSMTQAVTVAFAESFATVGENLKEIRPHFIPSVPRVYEKVYDKIITNVETAGGIKLKLFNWAVGVGMQESKLRQANKPLPVGLKLKHALARKLVLRKISDALGGRLLWAVSGAAPLNKTIAEFFDACGVTILEGIGMTENTSFSNVNRLGNNKFGTVGQPGPGVEQKIAGDGEVLFRGRNVMKGYFRDPEATAETIDNEGWLHSGDIGEIDDESFLKITDRKKDLIVTAGGKNIAPQRIERIMRTSHYIAQVVAIGDKKKYVSALVTLDPEAMIEWSAQHGVQGLSAEELAGHPEVRALIQAEIDKRNEQLASFESVKRFHVLPQELSIEGGELTPTLKIKRKVVIERYHDQIEALYAE